MDENNKSNEFLNILYELQNKISTQRNNQNISIRYYDKCPILIGGCNIEFTLVEIDEQKHQKGDNVHGISYELYIQYRGKLILVGEIGEDGSIKLSEEGSMILSEFNPHIVNKITKGDNKPDISEKSVLEGHTIEELKNKVEESKNISKDISKSKSLDNEHVTGKNKQEISLVKKQTIYDTVGGLIPQSDYYSSIYVEEGKNLDHKFIGVKNKGGKEIHEEIKVFSQTEGTNPTQTFTLIDTDGKITEGQMNSVYMIEGKGNREGFSVYNNHGRLEIYYWMRMPR